MGAPIQRTSSLDSTESEEGESDGRSGPEGVEVYVAGLRIDSKTLATEMHSWAHTEFSSFESDIRDASSAREPLQRLHRALHKQVTCMLAIVDISVLSRCRALHVLAGKRHAIMHIFVSWHSA